MRRTLRQHFFGLMFDSIAMAQQTRKHVRLKILEAVRRWVSQRRVRKPFWQTIWGGLIGMWVDQVLGVKARFVPNTGTVDGSPNKQDTI